MSICCKPSRAAFCFCIRPLCMVRTWFSCRFRPDAVRRIGRPLQNASNGFVSRCCTCSALRLRLTAINFCAGYPAHIPGWFQSSRYRHPSWIGCFRTVAVVCFWEVPESVCSDGARSWGTIPVQHGVLVLEDCWVRVAEDYISLTVVHCISLVCQLVSFSRPANGDEIPVVDCKLAIETRTAGLRTGVRPGGNIAVNPRPFKRLSA